MSGHCAGHDQRMAAAKRDRRFGARLARWTAPERAEFQRLRAAAGEFFDARSANEVDESGTARVALQIEEESPDDARRRWLTTWPPSVVNMLLDAWAAALGQPAAIVSKPLS
jgi:hypothetical protein